MLKYLPTYLHVGMVMLSFDSHEFVQNEQGGRLQLTESDISD